MPHLDLAQRKSLHSGAYVAHFDQAHRRRVARLAERLKFPPDAAVADFGCGSALLLEHLKDRVGLYVGVDFSEEFIALARARARSVGASNAEFYCGRIEDFGRDNPDRFDAVLALDLSEHVYDDEWRAVVENAFRILKPGGVVYLHTPNGEFFVERMKARNFLLKQYPQHVAVRSPAANAAFFHDAGFSDVRITAIAHYNVLRFLHALSYLPGLGRVFAARIFLTARKPESRGAGPER